MLGNGRITKKERGLLRAALRRVFARSDLRTSVLDEAEVLHSDPARPRVRRWCVCAICLKPEARSYVVVDHIRPVCPVTRREDEMELEETLQALWCDRKNLQCLDTTCHNRKSAEENKLRRINAKPKRS